ncbi:DNA polymerase IV [Eisenibacter elegans]|uniref:DNA polymerase IV n=1 Tax=Eisenibacter elegans TaxID=997 RepID=UPI0004227859|nr:DNA polymerase IV [Eisenibacter elegans]
MRKIIHIDMDAFFAAVEQRDNPALRGLPVAVGGSRKRGVVAAASYEARAFGVFSAMPTQTALRKCPQLVIVPTRFEVYRLVSAQIKQIFLAYTDLVEPLSLDEAYLDVSQYCAQQQCTATAVAAEIKEQIQQKTGLTASAGVSYNKFLAKIASDYRKPNGLFVITPKAAPEFLANLPVHKFHGIGKATATKMAVLGIHTGADICTQPLEKMVQLFGKAGRNYYHLAHGVDDRPVNPERIRKSIGTERTFEADLYQEAEILQTISKLSGLLGEQVAAKQLCGHTLTLKVRFTDFVQITRSQTFQQPLSDNNALFQAAAQLVPRIPNRGVGIRLLGLQVSNFEASPQKAPCLTTFHGQLQLFG